MKSILPMGFQAHAALPAGPAAGSQMSGHISVPQPRQQRARYRGGENPPRGSVLFLLLFFSSFLFCQAPSVSKRSRIMPIFIARTSPGSVCSGGTFSPETCRATESPSSRRRIFLSSVKKISRGYFRGLKNGILQIFSFCWCCVRWKSIGGPSPSLLRWSGYRSGTTSLLGVGLQDAK